MALEISVTWPAVVMQPELLLKPFIEDKDWPRYTVDYPRMVELEKKLKDLTVGHGKKKQDVLSSTARILLPYKVVSNNIGSCFLLDSYPSGNQVGQPGRPFLV